jgi:hypothetical protein
MRCIISLAMVAALMAPGTFALGQDAAGAGAPLEHLDRAERHLLAALHAIRDQPPGPRRDAALDETRQALVRTQAARGGTVRALGQSAPPAGDPVREARAVFQAVAQAQDAAVRGDRARIGHALDRAEHALSMAPVDPLEREVVDSWLAAARTALQDGDRRALRRALEQAEWAFRGNVRPLPQGRPPLGQASGG